MSVPYQLAWFGCDQVTGGIVEDLPALKPTAALSRRLGDSTTLALDLALGGAPAEWEAATAEGRSMVVAVDQATDLPLWAGLVITRDGGSGPTVQLGTATPERYLDSRYPGAVHLYGTDWADIATALVTPALDGLPLVVDAPPTGALGTYEVADADDKTSLSCLQEVAALEGGPEWTIDVAWNAGHTGFVLPFRVRPAIGTQVADPEAVFDFPGSVVSYTLSSSYEQGKGATRLIARGEGEGASRLTSAPASADALLAAGWPVWEYRYTPATGVTDPDQLTAHAAAALATMATGAQVWTCEAAASAAPRLGRDWGLGDSVRLAVEHSPRHPAGADVVARAWSWELDPGADRVRPILIEED